MQTIGPEIIGPPSSSDRSTSKTSMSCRRAGLSPAPSHRPALLVLGGTRPQPACRIPSYALGAAAHRGEFLDLCGRHRLGPLFELAVHTCLRRGEIAGSHWLAVNLAARTIVRHNRVSVDGRVQETTTRTAPAAVRCRCAMRPCCSPADLAAPPGQRRLRRPRRLADRWSCIHHG